LLDTCLALPDLKMISSVFITMPGFIILSVGGIYKLF